MTKRKIVHIDNQSWGTGRSEGDNQKQFWNEILGWGNYEDAIKNGTDGLYKNVLFEFKKGFSKTGYTKGMALDESVGYLSKFNNAAIIIPSYIVVSSFNTKDFFVYEAKQFIKQIYNPDYCLRKSHVEKLTDLNAKPIFKGVWTKPVDLIKRISKYLSKPAIKFKVNLINFHKLNDMFYDKLDNLYKNKTEEYYKDKKYHEPKLFIREIKYPQILNLIPNDISEIKDIVAAKWDHVGGSESIKNRGAYFTPDRYVKISTEWIKKAIPKKKPYIIIDRCAGSGNLEKMLTSEEKKHCLLNTYEYCEWIYLASKYDEWGKMPSVKNVGRKCQVIPPFNKKSLESVYIDEEQGDGDALTKTFNNWLISFLKHWRRQNKNGVVIFLENPPFKDMFSNKKGGTATSSKEVSWVYEQMKGIEGRGQKENQFIWSAFKLFLAKGDSYILYSPIKYWKTQHIIDRDFIKGYICNRKYFTDDKGDYALPLIWWKNKPADNLELSMESDLGNRIVKKVKNPISALNVGEKNGTMTLEIRNFSFASPRMTASITNTGKYGNKKCSVKGLLNKAPLFCAGRNPFAETGDKEFSTDGNKDYTAIDTIYKTSDGGVKYLTDDDFLRHCFIWTCLTQLQQCISTTKNQNPLALCQKSGADQIIKKLSLDDDDEDLILKWKEVLSEARQCLLPEACFNRKYKYGLYQIIKDLCPAVEENVNKFGKKEYPKAYITLNDKVDELKRMLLQYYKKHIHNNLFKYMLLK